MRIATCSEQPSELATSVPHGRTSAARLVDKSSGSLSLGTFCSASDPITVRDCVHKCGKEVVAHGLEFGAAALTQERHPLEAQAPRGEHLGLRRAFERELAVGELEVALHVEASPREVRLELPAHAEAVPACGERVFDIAAKRSSISTSAIQSPDASARCHASSTERSSTKYAAKLHQVPSTID
jgi:hypothetical protein